MTGQEFLDETVKYEAELAKRGFAGVIDGPVSRQFHDELLADFNKELSELLEDMKQQAA